MTGALALSLARLRGRGSRALLAALGIFAAGAMLGTAITVSYGLRTGFDRAAERADLPDVVARFDARDAAEVERRIDALPNLAARSLRFEVTNVDLATSGHRTSRGAVQVAERGRRGYTLMAGRDLSTSRSGEVLVEQGLAREWGLHPGSRLSIGGLGVVRVAGVTLSPDNVAYPLAQAARVYVTREDIDRQFGRRGEPRANLALIWARDPGRIDELLVQARTAGYGLRELRFVTRDGVRVLVGEAAGIVIALLASFALVTLAAAGVMLSASAHAEVQRRLSSIGVLRSIGFSRGAVAGQQALDALVVAVPAGALGLTLGALAARGPTGRLLLSLNELPPGAAIVPWLVAALVALAALVAASAAWPAWRAAGRPPAHLLRGGQMTPRPRRGGVGLVRGGFAVLGARLVMARRARLGATVGVLAAAVAVVLLMLGLADALDRLRNDPSVLGKRYSLTVAAPASDAPDIARVAGVAAAAPRYEVRAADSFQLGETLTLIAFPSGDGSFESPPLARGHRARGKREVEVGQGLADVLGLSPGSTLAVELGNGDEVRFRVAGVVRALQREGRVAYASAETLLRADPTLVPQIAVRVNRGADPVAVTRTLAAAGYLPARAGAATTSNARFLSVLATLLRIVAAIDAAVCVYALVQVLALTARERQGVVSVLRASGAGLGAIARVFTGAALITVALAAPLAVLVERWALGPFVTGTAAGYGDLSATAGPAELLVTLAGLALLALFAAVVTARRMVRAPVVEGLREEPA